MERLAEQEIHEAATIELGRSLNADIGTAAAFGAVPAGELVDPEQVCVVEHEALRVLVRQASNHLFVRPHDDLRDRLDRLRAPWLSADEGIAVLEANGRHHPA